MCAFGTVLASGNSPVSASKHGCFVFQLVGMKERFSKTRCTVPIFAFQNFFVSILVDNLMNDVLKLSIHALQNWSTSWRCHLQYTESLRREHDVTGQMLHFLSWSLSPRWNRLLGDEATIDQMT
jgi:hypothetical protein